nr:phenol degradative protein activator, putative [Tanacetum cinerariifolium]
PFVALNCAAIPESLIESELFGYRGGSFTGARKEGMRGKLQQADGGTLFLDEIGDMPVALQTRLLRVLEDRLLLDFLLEEEAGGHAVVIEPAARDSLLAFNWPGNVRQMRNVLRTLAALCED